MLRALPLVVAVGLLSITVPLGVLSPAGKASAYCIEAGEDCVNPCYEAGWAYETARNQLPSPVREKVPHYPFVCPA